MVRSAQKKPAQSPDLERIVKTEVVCPNDTNPMGILQGGRLVQWMDIAAAVCAQTFAGCICVTASIDRVSFKHPAKVGDILVIEAVVTRTFRTSMVITVKAWASSVGQTARRLISDSDFVFVAINKKGKPTSLPLLKQGKK